MANFKFKIISKILADRLAQILPNIISKEQRGFIKGRQIRDCICLTSEAINMLHKKSFGGNLTVKIDIAKAFDTIDWQLLLKVLKAFGFSPVFCSWIHTILNSAKLSISINGKQEGYFDCARGVRQGDPLSPLFCLAEEVLSRGLLKLVEDGQLKLINGTRTSHIPSHILYADDIMLFCKGTSSNIQILSDFFVRYAQNSGQVRNPQKSTIFGGSISHTRLSHIANQLNFNIATLPF
ncbi:RNA-directed DNA polymerase (Reverse transcriptase), partial [Trifolium medium]|nr:RNA-directed DNA polymerase (Reverse transcriptase) [Trifolium medium]